MAINWNQALSQGGTTTPAPTGGRINWAQALPTPVAPPPTLPNQPLSTPRLQAYQSAYMQSTPDVQKTIQDHVEARYKANPNDLNAQQQYQAIFHANQALLKSNIKPNVPEDSSIAGQIGQVTRQIPGAAATTSIGVAKGAGTLGINLAGALLDPASRYKTASNDQEQQARANLKADPGMPNKPVNNTGDLAYQVGTGAFDKLLLAGSSASTVVKLAQSGIGVVFAGKFLADAPKQIKSIQQTPNIQDKISGVTQLLGAAVLLGLSVKHGVDAVKDLPTEKLGTTTVPNQTARDFVTGTNENISPEVASQIKQAMIDNKHQFVQELRAGNDISVQAKTPTVYGKLLSIINDKLGRNVPLTPSETAVVQDVATRPESYVPAVTDAQPTGLEALAGDPIAVANNLHLQAKAAAPQFIKDVAEVAKSNDSRPATELNDFAVKSADSTLEKIARKGDVPTDMVRATIEIKSPSQLTGIVNDFKAKGYQVKEIDDLHTDPAATYKHIALKLTTPNSPLVHEVQLLQPHMLTAKMKPLGHDIYDVSKSVDRWVNANGNHPQIETIHKGLMDIMDARYKQAYALDNPSSVRPTSTNAAKPDFGNLSASERSAVNGFLKTLSEPILANRAVSGEISKGLESVINKSNLSASSVPQTANGVNKLTTEQALRNQVEEENSFLEANRGKTIEGVTIPKDYRAHRRTITGATVDVNRLKTDPAYFKQAYESTFARGYGTDEVLYKKLVKALVPEGKEASGALADLYHQAEKTGASGGVTLQSTVLPGAAEFVQQDVIPKTKSAVENIKATAKEVKSIVSPATTSPAAAKAASAVREYKASSANTAAKEQAIGKNATKLFNHQSDAENIKAISEYERTGRFPKVDGVDLTKYSEQYKASTDEAHARKVATFGTNRAGYIEFYVRRAGLFDFKNPTAENKAVSALLSTKSSLKAYDASNKQRTLDMPLDEALAAMKAKGLVQGRDFKLTTTNPETLRQQAVNSAEQAFGFKEMGNDLKEQGLVKFVRGGNIPDGFVKLDDQAFKIFFPADVTPKGSSESFNGLVKSGEYYASPEVAKILNNAISKGLAQYSIFRGIRNVKNNFNLLQLGFSAFHAGTTTLNASLNDMVLGERALLNGDAKGLAQVGRGLIPGASVIRDTYLGSKAFKAFASENPESAALMREILNPSGFRLRMENTYKTTVSENLTKALANGNYPGVALRAIPAIIEQTTKPIMEHLVPNVKLQAMLDRAQAIQKANPNLTDAELKVHLQKASDSMDNIYGQMVYDNVFWNKTVKDLLQVSQRSVGWNLGTVREVGGGVTDLASALTGQKKGYGSGASSRVSDKTLFALSLPLLIGLYGAAYQYLHTKKAPTSLLDYFYPKNGATDANGKPQRVSLPSYMKDVIAYGKDPLGTIKNKLSGPLSTFAQILDNKNYYGDMVRNPQDPIATQLMQVGKYALANLTPFSLQSAAQVKAGGGNLASQAESFIGITKGPAWTTKSKFEQAISSRLSAQINSGPLTPEQQDAIAAKSAAREQIKTGQGSALADALSFSSQTKADKFKADSQMTSMQRNFNSLNAQNQAEVLKLAKPEDIKALGNLDQLKRDAAYTITSKTSSPANKVAAQVVLDKLGGGDVNQLSHDKRAQINAQARATRAKNKH